jgi:hypothetical protein
VLRCVRCGTLRLCRLEHSSESCVRKPIVIPFTYKPDRIGKVRPSHLPIDHIQESRASHGSTVSGMRQYVLGTCCLMLFCGSTMLQTKVHIRSQVPESNRHQTKFFSRQAFCQKHQDSSALLSLRSVVRCCLALYTTTTTISRMQNYARSNAPSYCIYRPGSPHSVNAHTSHLKGTVTLLHH